MRYGLPRDWSSARKWEQALQLAEGQVRSVDASARRFYGRCFPEILAARRFPRPDGHRNGLLSGDRRLVTDGNLTKAALIKGDVVQAAALASPVGSKLPRSAECSVPDDGEESAPLLTTHFAGSGDAELLQPVKELIV